MKKLLQYSAAAALVAAGLGIAHADDSSTHLSGRIYWDFSDIQQKTDEGPASAKSGYGFDVKRFYLGVDHKFDQTWAINLTTDFNYNSSAGKSTVFVKKAYLEGNFDPLLKVRLGSTDMPWIPFMEDLYGYRYVENTVVDRLGYGNSADWGAHAMGKYSVFNYQVSVVNGAGYSNVSGRSRRPDLEARLGIEPVKGLVAAYGLYNGKLGKSVNGGPDIPVVQRQDFTLGYVSHGFRVGGEYFYLKNPKATADKATGFSAWASAEVYKGLSLFGRFDEVKPTRDTGPSAKDLYYNVGAEYVVRKGVKFSVVYKDDRAKANSGSTTKTNEIGLFSEVRF